MNCSDWPNDRTPLFSRPVWQCFSRLIAVLSSLVHSQLPSERLFPPHAAPSILRYCLSFSFFRSSC